MSKLDATIQFRCKRSTLATGLLYLEKEGIIPRSKSELCRLMIELCEDALLKGCHVRAPSSEEAERILSRFELATTKDYGQNLTIVPSFKVGQDLLVEETKKAMEKLGFIPDDLPLEEE